MSSRARDLGGPLLRSVSRSFFLTIRVLPARLRDPIGLAYLLARASDTIADSAAAPADVRLCHLAAFGEMIARGATDGLPALQRDIQPPDDSERSLIARLGDCLAWLAAQDAPAQAEIRAVMEKIIRGQTLDLQRFPAQADGAIVALQTAEELDEYTYLVAGCVGEFWTRLCTQRLPRYSALNLAELCRLGIHYGKGLQLVNILRDLPADLRSGRCYLPEDELRASGTSPAALLHEPHRARPVFFRWHERAQSLLDDGRRYIAAIRPARLRMGCFLPWRLGVATLDLLAAQPPLEAAARLKVPRRTVRAALLRGVVAAFSDAPLRPRHAES
jgi:farnesyl-diphosphate farnesyltransferase